MRGSSPTFKEILLDVDESVASLTLNRPSARNAWTLRMDAEVREALAVCDADDGVRAVVITGAGDCFCVGADLSSGDIEAPGGRPEPSGRPRLSPPDVRKPVIAALNGHAVGIGTTFAMLCDICVVASTAKVGLPFVRRGVISEANGHWMLPRLIGVSRAAELLLTGRLLSGVEAAEMGLCPKAVTAETVLATAMEIGREVASSTAPLAVAASKRVLWEALEMSRPEAERRESQLFHWLAGHPDTFEGVSSFLEHRSPRWSGRASRALPPIPSSAQLDNPPEGTTR